MITTLICLAIALHDVDGPIHCASGERIRLQGIGALEMNGTAREGQPSVPGDPREQRRIMARVIGAEIAHEDASIYGQAWFARGVELTCEVTGQSEGKGHTRVVAWCKRPDGKDLSCEAIRAGIALRWRGYDKQGRLVGCDGERTQ